jgi:hypothetical protein
LTVVIALLCLVLGSVAGVLVTRAWLAGSGWPSQPVSATLTASELSTVVGSYRYNGEYRTVTAKEVLASATGLEAAQLSDGTYEAPTADMVLAYVRNLILNDMVADYGIQVSDAEVSAYAFDVFGTSDMQAIAASLGSTVDAARQAVTEAAAVHALRLQLAGSSAAPAEPVYPADGNTEVANAAYADYIIGLLGSHWDATYQTWADTDNAYYPVLSNLTFAAGSANYEAALAAYGVAVQLNQESDTSLQLWTDAVNAYLENASITVGTLRA